MWVSIVCRYTSTSICAPLYYKLHGDPSVLTGIYNFLCCRIKCVCSAKKLELCWLSHVMARYSPATVTNYILVDSSHLTNLRNYSQTSITQTHKVTFKTHFWLYVITKNYSPVTESFLLYFCQTSPASRVGFILNIYDLAPQACRAVYTLWGITTEG